MKPLNLTPRQAIHVARELGWLVAPKSCTGEIRYIDPTGRRFTSIGIGRTHQVPRNLAAELHKAKQISMGISG